MSKTVADTAKVTIND